MKNETRNYFDSFACANCGKVLNPSELVTVACRWHCAECYEFFFLESSSYKFFYSVFECSNGLNESITEAIDNIISDAIGSGKDELEIKESLADFVFYNSEAVLMERQTPCKEFQILANDLNASDFEWLVLNAYSVADDLLRINRNAFRR